MPIAGADTLYVRYRNGGKMRYISGKNKMAERIGKWIVTACFCLVTVLCLAPHLTVSAATGKVSASSANIRSSADSGSTVVASVLNGNKLNILEETTGTDGKVWYKVEVDANRTGYIRSDLVTKDGGSTTTTTTTATTATTTGTGTSNVNSTVTVNTEGVTEVQPVSATVNKDGVRVRGDSNTTSGIVTTATKNLVVTVSGYKANGSETWYLSTFMIDSKEVQGYIRSDFVTLSGELAAPETQSETPVDDGADVVTEEPEEAPAYEAEQEEDTWYLIDNVAGKKYPINRLITEAEQNAVKLAASQKKVSNLKTAVIVLVIILALILMGVSFLIFKVRDMMDDGFDMESEKRQPRRSQERRPDGQGSSRNEMALQNGKAVGKTHRAADGRTGARPEGTTKGHRPAGEAHRTSAGAAQGARPAGSRPAGNRPTGTGVAAQGQRPTGTRPAGEAHRASAGTAQGARPAGNGVAAQGQRPAGSRPAGTGLAAQSQRTGTEVRPAAERSSQSEVRPVMQGSAGFRGKSRNFIEDDDDFSFEFLNK